MLQRGGTKSRSGGGDEWLRPALSGNRPGPCTTVFQSRVVILPAAALRWENLGKQPEDRSFHSARMRRRASKYPLSSTGSSRPWPADRRAFSSSQECYPPVGGSRDSHSLSRCCPRLGTMGDFATTGCSEVMVAGRLAVSAHASAPTTTVGDSSRRSHERQAFAATGRDQVVTPRNNSLVRNSSLWMPPHQSLNTLCHSDPRFSNRVHCIHGPVRRQTSSERHTHDPPLSSSRSFTA